MAIFHERPRVYQTINLDTQHQVSNLSVFERGILWPIYFVWAPRGYLVGPPNSYKKIENLDAGVVCPEFLS